jgi:hypothetical protein
MRITWWLSLGLGVFLGYWGRATILPQYRPFVELWWISLIFLTLCIGFLSLWMRNRRPGDQDRKSRRRYERKDDVGKPYWPAVENEPLISENMDLPVYQIEVSGKRPNSQIRHEADPANGFHVRETEEEVRQTRRKVRLRRMLTRGKEEPHSPIVGVELSPPEEGKEYRLLTDDGIFYTSVVTFVSPGYIRTKSCFFSIDVLDTTGPLSKPTNRPPNPYAVNQRGQFHPTDGQPFAHQEDLGGRRAPIGSGSNCGPPFEFN